MIKDYIEITEPNEYLKKYGFALVNKHRQPKPLLYKGISTDGKTTECKLIGIKKTNNYETFVICINEKQIYISPYYLLEMQSPLFSANKA